MHDSCTCCGSLLSLVSQFLFSFVFVCGNDYSFHVNHLVEKKTSNTKLVDHFVYFQVSSFC